MNEYRKLARHIVVECRRHTQNAKDILTRVTVEWVRLHLLIAYRDGEVAALERIAATREHVDDAIKQSMPVEGEERREHD